VSEGSQGNQQSPDFREEGINKLVKDCYRILGVERDAGPQHIREAFRRLALRHHPDRNPGNPKEAEDRFKEINEGYEVLGNEQKRHRYDYLANYRRSQIEKVRMNMIFSDRSGSFAYRNLEDLLRILVVLNFDRGELFMERRKGRGKFRGAINTGVVIGVECCSALGDPNSTVKVRC
jgi:curved DNA-binding protein CbpA